MQSEKQLEILGKPKPALAGLLPLIAFSNVGADQVSIFVALESAAPQQLSQLLVDDCTCQTCTICL